MSLIKGWCPGALRPMQTGDGLLVRLRVSCGILSFARARQIAALARKFGNGRLGLSARSNLQMRGVSEANFPPLIEELRALGLVDGSAESEAVRNVIASPLAGLSGLVDIRPIVQALEQNLESNEAFWRLPGKFGWAVDDGGPLPPGDVTVDVRFEAVRTASGVRFGLALAGADGVWFGLHSAAEIPALADKIAGLFVAARAQDLKIRRMKHLVMARGIAKLSEQLAPCLPRVALPAPDLAHLVNVQNNFVGAAIPFGVFDADALELLANTAEKYCATDLRLTPWRCLLATGVREADKLAGALAERFVMEASDGRLSIAACPGAPDCSSGETAAAKDALALAPLLKGKSGLILHVSGCSKGCAHPAKAPFTLVGRAGKYDLIVNGDAKSGPVLSGLTPQELTKVLGPRTDAIRSRTQLAAL